MTFNLQTAPKIKNRCGPTGSDSGRFFRLTRTVSSRQYPDCTSNSERSGVCSIENGWVEPELFTIKVITVAEFFLSILRMKYSTLSGAIDDHYLGSSRHPVLSAQYYFNDRARIARSDRAM